MEDVMRGPIVTMVAVCAITGIAGDARCGERAFGLKGGFVGASVDARGPAGFETNADVGPAIGGFATFQLTETVSLQPELLFTAPRFKSPDFGPGLAVRARAVEMPVLLQKQLRLRSHPVLFAGPNISFITRVTQEFDNVRSDISKEIRNVDIGVVAGGRFEVSTGRGAVLLEGRVNVGFRDLSASPDTSMNSRAFVGLFGYRF